MIANQQHSFPLRVPNAAGHLNHVVRDAEIKPAGSQPLAVAPREGRRHVGLVGRFVRAKTGIAIDPEDLRLGYIFGSELRQIGIDRAHQLQHRRLYVLVEKMLARLKPLAAVVALQAMKKLHHLRRKSSKSRSHETLLYNLTR